LLFTTGASVVNSTFWQNTSPTSTVFSIGTNGTPNPSAGTMVAYCFAAVAGYSAFGKYTGNGSADGPFVYLGFRPRFVMIKRTDSTGDWCIYDSSRGTTNGMGLYLYPNLSNAVGSASANLNFLSNGIKLTLTATSHNASGGTYIYAAFAEVPFRYANAR